MAGKKNIIPVSGGAVDYLVGHLHNNADTLVSTMTRGSGGLSDSSKPQPVTRGQHIFISYSHSDKDLVYRISNALKEKGYRVWIDVDRMGGNILESMALAVENSYLVLMCISKKYKDSKNCRTEAKYTFRQCKEYIIVKVQSRYEPDGWLGALLGTKLYYDFTDRESFHETMKKLTKEIDIVKRRTASIKRK